MFRSPLRHIKGLLSRNKPQCTVVEMFVLLSISDWIPFVFLLALGMQSWPCFAHYPGSYQPLIRPPSIPYSALVCSIKQWTQSKFLHNSKLWPPRSFFKLQWELLFAFSVCLSRQVLNMRTLKSWLDVKSLGNQHILTSFVSKWSVKKGR